MKIKSFLKDFEVQTLNDNSGVMALVQQLQSKDRNDQKLNDTTEMIRKLFVDDESTDHNIFIDKEMQRETAQKKIDTLKNLIEEAKSQEDGEVIKDRIKAVLSDIKKGVNTI